MTWHDELLVGHLLLRQENVTIKDYCIPRADVIIVTSSWEPRSSVITQMPVETVKSGIVIKFLEKDNEGDREKHDKAISDWLAHWTNNVTSIENVSIYDEQAVFAKLRTSLQNLRNELGRPLNVVFDMSGCPKIYMLYVLGIGFRYGIISKCIMLYAEATYFKGERQFPRRRAEYIFTEGEWRAVPVPYLEGRPRSGRDKKMLISLGLEGDKIKKLVARYEPDDWRFLIANPGFMKEYGLLGWQENDILFSQYEVEKRKVYEVGVGDVVGCVRECETIKKMWGDDEAIFMALGAKSHALAMGLCSLADERITVLTRMPETFVKTKTACNGRCWVYGIDDLSSM